MPFSSCVPRPRLPGNLKSGSQITVVEQSPQTIVIQSANPQVVYVPTYNPAVVYGTPYVYPGYRTGAMIATGMLTFGVGIAVGAMMSSGCCGWGYSSWNCGWHSTTVVYHGGAYYGNAAWHGGYYGGVAHYGAGYNSATGTYARGATAYNGYGSASVGQAYNPSTGTYARGASTSNAYGSAAQLRPTTQGPGPPPPRSKAPMPTAAGAVPPFRRTATPPTASTRRQLRAQPDRYKPRTGKSRWRVGSEQQRGDGGRPQTATICVRERHQYKNTGGWDDEKSGSWNRAQKPSGSSSWSQDASSRGWGGQEKTGGSSAFGGASGGGWDSRSASSRGWGSGAGVAVGAVVAAASAGRFTSLRKIGDRLFKLPTLFGRMLCSATPADLKSQRNRCFSP